MILPHVEATVHALNIIQLDAACGVDWIRASHFGSTCSINSCKSLMMVISLLVDNNVDQQTLSFTEHFMIFSLQIENYW